MRALNIVLALALTAARAGATCNVIPSADRVFQSADGSVSRPFARPGDEVIVRQATAVFAPEAGGNTVTLAFQPLGGDEEILVERVAAEPRECAAAGCAAVRFVFPDTRARDLTGNYTLAGPVQIRVRTGARETARIGELYIGDSGFRDDLFPHFVALPPANRFSQLPSTDRLSQSPAPGGDILAAEDTAGNLFIPLDFTGIVPADENRTHFLEARIPELGKGGGLRIDVFTVAGQRLPPLARQVGTNGDDIIGTADTPESVLRIDKGALRPRLVPVDGGGPLIVRGVSGSAEASKQADPRNIVVGQSFAVYEARDPADPCIHLLHALDLRLPNQTPFVVNDVDACAFFPVDRPSVVYSFSASDALVAYRIQGVNGESTPLRSGAFDLEQRVDIPLATGSPRQEVAGSLLAFVRDEALYWYDARTPHLPPRRVGNYLVRVHSLAGIERGQRIVPHDLAVNGDRIAFVDKATNWVLLFHPGADTVTPVGQMTGDFAAATLAMTPTRVAFQSTGTSAVAVRRFDAPSDSSRDFCGSEGLLVPSVSDSIIPCRQNDALTVMLSDGTYPLGLRRRRDADVQVSGDVLLVGVYETDQGLDLDGRNGIQDVPVLQTYSAIRRGAPTNFGQPIIKSTPPFVQFISGGLAVLIGTEANPVRRFFRDVDGDGVFEEPTPGGPIADNCPTIPNPDQRGGDRGVGKACECPVLRVDTVRTFAGSRVRVPVDFEPGLWDVASMNLTADARSGLGIATFEQCTFGAIIRAVRAGPTCVENPPGVITTFVPDAGRRDIRRIGAGELASYEFSLMADSDGRRFNVCVEPVGVGEPLAYGDLFGGQIECTPPRHCGEVRVDPFCKLQGDCNCDGRVNAGDRVCLITKFFDPSLRGTCDCEDCNLSGRLNAADAPCITRCSFGDCVTERR